MPSASSICCAGPAAGSQLRREVVHGLRPRARAHAEPPAKGIARPATSTPVTRGYRTITARWERMRPAARSHSLGTDLGASSVRTGGQTGDRRIRRPSGSEGATRGLPPGAPCVAWPLSRQSATCRAGGPPLGCLAVVTWATRSCSPESVSLPSELFTFERGVWASATDAGRLLGGSDHDLERGLGRRRLVQEGPTGRAVRRAARRRTAPRSCARAARCAPSAWPRPSTTRSSGASGAG